ncbi:MAG: FtsQ-type POTRA domain-containing protein [Anaerolineae bacterium]|nr:FtsQ-type POTRA domain-containing protein [Anaerolineae bacterium]
MSSSTSPRPRRERSDRAVGVLRPEALNEAPSIQHGARQNAINWRFISGLMLASLSLMLFLMMTADIFIVRGIALSGAGYLDAVTVYTYSGVAGKHVLDIDAEEVRRGLLEIPTIAEAEVILGWPPDLVRIRIVERQPAVLWNQNDVEAWVDIHGRVLTAPLQERPDLITIVTRDIEGVISLNDRIPQDVIDGARQLVQLVPDERRLRYDPLLGLGFRDNGGWQAWFGSGLDMPVKIMVYRRVVEELAGRGVTPSVINVADPDQPYCSGC